MRAQIQNREKYRIVYLYCKHNKPADWSCVVDRYLLRVFMQIPTRTNVCSGFRYLCNGIELTRNRELDFCRMTHLLLGFFS